MVAYSYDPERRLLSARPEGVLYLAAIRDYFQAVVRDDTVAEVDVELVDLRQVTDIVVSYSEMVSMGTDYEEMKRSKGIRLTLFVAPGDLQFGVARMFRGALGDVMRSKVVRSLEEAEREIAALLRD